MIHRISVDGMPALLMAVLVQAALPSQGRAGPEDTSPLNPIWTHTLAAGVEWCAPVGGEPATGLLVCDKRAQLDLVNLQTGRSRFAEPIAVQPGVRFAGGTREVAYCYGPSRVYALRISTADQAGGEQPGVLWKVAAAPKAETEGDPEFLIRVVAASATPGGVLIVRSDDRVAELNRSDGRVRWQRKLPTTVSCTLHVHGATAALLWKRGDAFSVAFFDLRAEWPQPAVTSVSQTLPIWTALIDDGLVAVWPRQLALIPAKGRPRFHKLHEGLAAGAATVAVYAPAARPSSRPAARDSSAPALLLTSENGLLWAYDFHTDELRRLEQDQLSLPAPAEACRSLWVSGDSVFRLGRYWFAVCSAQTGEGFRSHLRPGDALGAGASRGVAYGLFVSSQQRLWLVRQVSAPAEPRAGANATPVARDFDLGQAGRVRETFWLQETLVVVEDNRVRAYTLP